MTTKEQRQRMAEIMDLLVDQRGKVHYAQIRPMRTTTIHTLPQLRRSLRSRNGVTMDCSESVTLICHLAGLRDPNGRHYDGQGYTGTLLTNPSMKHYTEPGRAGIGALLVLGDWPGEHVCMVRHPGPDPVLFSHGCEADPNYYPYSTIRAAFPGQTATFLSIHRLGI